MVDSFLNIQHKSTTWSSDSTPRYLPNRNENTCPCEDLYTIFHSSFVCHCAKLETIPMPIDRWMDKWTTVYTPPQYNEVNYCVHTAWFHLFKNVRKCKHIYSNRKQVSDCLGRWVGGAEDKGQGNFEGWWSDRYVHFLDFGDNFIAIYIRQTLSYCIF